MSKAIDLENKVHELIRFAKSKEEILKIIERDMTESERVASGPFLESAIGNLCDNYPNYGLIQFFKDSEIVSDKDGEDDLLYMFNRAERTVKTIAKKRLAEIISPKLRWHNKHYVCEFEYNPVKPYKLACNNGAWIFNLYEPPVWMHDYFYSQGEIKIPKLDKLPALYDKFFRHLVAGDEKSLAYMLDWMANALHRRNYCYLTTIGTQGIGKGLLGDIMKELFGLPNFQQTGQNLISEKFNGQIASKKLVYIDELIIKSATQENKLKTFVNNNIEVEKKGLDAKMIVNHANIYLSSNDIDAIKISADDRRFSVLNLTDVKLNKNWKIEQIASLLDPKNIAKLASYLFYRKFDISEVNKIFQSKTRELIRSTTLNRWQEWFIDDYYPGMIGKTVPVKQVGFDIRDGADLNTHVGRPTIEKFKQYNSDYIQLKNTVPDEVYHKEWGDKRQWCVIFKDRGVQNAV